jgi:hypothetical protein
MHVQSANGGTPAIYVSTADNSLNTDQLMGRFAVYKNDPSAGGVGVTASIDVKSGTSIGSTSYMTFGTDGGSLSQERMRIDSSGNLLVGTTTLANYTNSAGTTADDGLSYQSIGILSVSSHKASANVGFVQYLNRTNTDGGILQFRKAGTAVGSIGTSGGYYFINGGNSGGTHAGLRFINNASIRPCNTTGNNLDNTLDLGSATARFDDIYATNGTIQTSDRNEKQDIAELSDAEQRVAVAAKGLLRKFRWKDAVAEKGDEARTHFGIIAQDLQAAFAAEGLDAGDYAMFISSTWTDEETGEERTRMGVRYSELLAFIIAAI